MFLYPDETLFSLIEYFSLLADNLKSKRITISSTNIAIDKLSKSMSAKKPPKNKVIDSFKKESNYAQRIENSIERRFEKLRELEKYKRKQELEDTVSLNSDFFNPELGQFSLFLWHIASNSFYPLEIPLPNAEKQFLKNTADTESKPKIIETKWALSRVNTFDDNSKTFEIIENLEKSYRYGRTEAMFAVLPNGTTIYYVTV